MTYYKARLKEFDQILLQNVINLTELKKLSFHGIPDDQGKRALCWRLLLNYLPCERQRWVTYLQEKRTLYKQLIAVINLDGTNCLLFGTGSK